MQTFLGVSRPVTRIFCGEGGGGGGGLTRPKWTKLPKSIFYCLIRFNILESSNT